MKVTSLKAQIKNSQRVSIFVEQEYAFSLSLDELVKLRLKKGDELDASELKKLKKLSADGKLRSRALEWLMNRPHSEREFRDYLYRKKAEPEQIESLVDEFSTKTYLDNMKFAIWFSELLARRNKSNRQIRAELHRKGISREVVETIMSQSLDEETQRLRQLIDKKQSLSRYQNDPMKLIKYLTSQGYSYQLVKQQLNISEPES